MLDKKQLEEVQQLLLDLDWEVDRMSQDGVEALDKLCAIFNVQ